MPVIDSVSQWQDELVAWRRDLHAHPELAFDERRTSDLVAQRLADFGIEVHRGLATTGVVGVLRGAPGNRAIGLRADMDALPMQEDNDFGHRSRNAGRMHACGHDGHTTMLLGAARWLAQAPDFAGTVYFIFQPAEEKLGGAQRMIDEGLFERFPVEAVYGMHNWPGLPVGEFAVHTGPAMAAADEVTIEVIGRGGHGALPHLAVDPIVIAAEIVLALQTLVSRGTDPLGSVVLSIATIHAGQAANVIPERATIGGSVRTFTPQARARMEEGIRRMAEGIAGAHGARAEVRYEKLCPATFNTAPEADHAARAAAAVVGAGRVHRALPPCMGSEDFAYMLQARPGCYVWLGNGDGEGGCMLHNPRYDFADAALPLGISYWARLVETVLAPGGQDRGAVLR